jgi:hypothetical protein
MERNFVYVLQMGAWPFGIYFNICFTAHFYDSTVFTPPNAQFHIYSE